MADEPVKNIPIDKVEIECPKCHHKFWHHIGDAFKAALDGLGNAIGEAKWGE
jgi:hypothetical protein